VSRTNSNRGTDLQFGFSEQHGQAVYDRTSRHQKARKTLAILKDCLGPLDRLTALDLGCAAGNSTIWYSEAFQRIVAVDIDSSALRHAQQNNSADNIAYVMMNGEQLAFRDETFDVVICAHVYEHVPDSRVLLAEIERLLKPGGACFFSAGNRLSIMEPHYRLPFLSMLPRFASHLYLRALNRGHYYYEKHLTYWQLRKLVAGFELLDYTKRVVDDPERYFAEDVVKPGSATQLVSRCLLKVAHWACPTYLWILRKPQNFERLT
jgi:2-polyprenyl-3-methyl-5-hydroxy-6-metoxy-1,4-benzoquinol methylase